jgi:hypothetical protein
MAVVQISKIQLRRGKKNAGTGLPQLASGEMAWAIDSQELFIGNGAVSEGAPYVGRTKILTEHDSILDLVANYTYKYDSELNPPQSSINGAVTRTLQSRLDDGVVNARNFGIEPSLPKSYLELINSDISKEDQSEKIQQAIDSITVGSSNVTIEFDPGEYYIYDTITLPSNVKISGYGKDKTIFTYLGSSADVFTTETASTKIKLNDFTVKIINNNKLLLNVNNAKECELVNIKFLYETNVSNVAGSIANNRIGIKLTGNGTVSYNRFVGCEFKNLTYGVYADNSASFNKFDDCLLEFLYQGFNLGAGNAGGANYNTISNCIFDNITRQGLFVQEGTGNRSRGNTYKNVGADITGTIATFSVIKFVTNGNSSIHDIFERQRFLEPNNPLFNNNSYLAEIDGISYREKSEPRQITLFSTTIPTMAFKVGIGNATGVQVNYVYRSTVFDQMRRGTLSIAVDKDLNLVQLSDEYEYVGLSPAGENAVLFTATLQESSGVKVLRINYINNNVGDANTFTYTYSVLS